jgi:beta-glucanase (GH16 family)
LTLTTTNITGAELLDQYTLNLTAAGVCTETGDLYCAITSNLTSGAIINPVRSARLTTKGLKAIIYGRVEVVAKLPAGDWMWPAIRLMPVDSAYGIWPRSGEIDIIQSRGNDPKTYPGGRDWVSSALHWGIDLDRDAVQQTTGLHWLRRSDYSLDFHTFGMEWSENYLYTYIDNRLAQVLNVKFAKKDMWSRLPPVDGGGS